jgi:CHAT domain-containing protein
LAGRSPWQRIDQIFRRSIVKERALKEILFMDPTNQFVLNENQTKAVRMNIINQYAGNPKYHFTVIIEEARIRAHQYAQTQPNKLNVCQYQWFMHNAQKHLVQKFLKKVLRELPITLQQLKALVDMWDSEYGTGQPLMIYDDF